MLVEAWLARAASTAPARDAVQTPAGRWTYAELYVAARAGEAQLRALGAGPGDRVAIALTPGLGFAQALHACLLLGAVAMPVDLRLGPAERAAIIGTAAVVLDEPLAPGGRTSAPAAAATHDLDAVAVIIHTSGTTAAPRPIALTFGNFLWSALGSAVALGLHPRERWLCAMPLSHVGGLSILVRSAIYATTALVHEGFDADRVREALGHDQVTLISVVATTLIRLLDAGLVRPAHLRCALAGGGPVPDTLLERARDQGVPVSQTYGLTESCSQATTVPLAAVHERGHGAGPPLFCTQLRCLGAEAGSREGEILLAGPTIAAAARDRDGWLHTGDLGWRDETGALHVSGRLADTIISGGENVAPTEVESVLESHPEVLEAAVLARADAEWGEAVTALVLLRSGSDAQPEDLRRHCQARLAGYKVPRRVFFISEPLPRTASGKLLRRALA